ncbi:MAG TPA: type II CAAX endopeptidase family protein [Anaerolineales bacterium]|nr:type II CAAX endopeptidase family protein [Anaerolineales bacterium]
MADIQPAQNRSFLSRIFISQHEPRLRAGWRLLIQTILLILISILVFLVASLFGPVVGGSLFLEQFLNFIAISGSVYIARRWLDKRSFESLGLKLNGQTFVDILAGIGITFIQMGFIYVLMQVLGWLTFEGFAWEFDPINVVITSVLTFFIVFIFVGWNEELLSRGYHLQTIASGMNLFWGVVISSAVFGLLHLGNPNATWVSAAGIFFAGVFLAYGYIRTRQLWLPIGLHIGWNFFEGVVFGFPVSGLDIYALTRIQVHGPELWTGGAFGPEAGLIVLPALVLGAVLIYFYTPQRVDTHPEPEQPTVP